MPSTLERMETFAKWGQEYIIWFKLLHTDGTISVDQVAAGTMPIVPGTTCYLLGTRTARIGCPPFSSLQLRQQICLFLLKTDFASSSMSGFISLIFKLPSKSIHGQGVCGKYPVRYRHGHGLMGSLSSTVHFIYVLISLPDAEI